MMEKKVIKTIECNNLIKNGETVIIGVSGGADSMALLNVFLNIRKRYNLSVIAAHINHGLRAEAAEEAEFVKEFCEKNDVRFCLREADVHKISVESGLTEEQAGRNVRYDFFEELCQKYNADKIATAHHKNDNAETVLMHIIRGAGINGIRGIGYKRDNIIRPLLDVTRTEIEKYCVKNEILFCTDKTNFSTDYTRNKIRLLTIPHIEKEYNNSFVDALSQLSLSAKEDDEFIEKKALEAYKETVKDFSISITGLNALDMAVKRRVIRMMIQAATGKREDISFIHIESVIGIAKEYNTGKSVNLPEGVSAYTEYDRLVIKKNAKSGYFKYTLKLNERVYIKESGMFITMTEKNTGEVFILPDYDNVYVTSRKNGDVFYPNGMTGRKKLKDFFIDIKLSKSERSLIPIIRYKDEILCVGNKRYDRRYSGIGKGVAFKFEKDKEGSV